MGWQRRLLGSVSGVAVLLAVATACAQGQSPRAELLKKSSIVFVGTVERVGAASFSGVPVSPRTVVVRVDAVLEKPASVSLVQGDKATVEVQDSALFRGGMQATFYADGWIFGEGVAVREVGHEPSPVAMRTEAPGQNASEVSQTRKQLSDDELRARIQAADMVMVGSSMALSLKKKSPVLGWNAIPNELRIPVATARQGERPAVAPLPRAPDNGAAPVPSRSPKGAQPDHGQPTRATARQA